jgi:hypothetical protein
MSVRKPPEPPPTRYGAHTRPVQARSATAAPAHAILQAKATRQVPPPPTRFGSVQTAVQAKTGHVPAPPTRFGPPAPAVQAKPVHVPPPSRFAPVGHVVLQNRSLRPGAVPPLHAGPPRFHAIQAKITVSVAPPPQFSHDNSRPSSHLNKSTLEALVEDIKNNGAKNDVEERIQSELVSGKTAKQIVNDIVQNRWLSKNGYDVCHKTPYGNIQKAVLDLINDQFGKTAPVAGWDKLDDYIQSINGKSTFVSALKTAATAAMPSAAAIAGAANNLLLHFDSLPDNLYFGYATTNRSIGDNADLHYDALSSGSNPEPPSPRGSGALRRLQSFETAVGRMQTDEVMETDTSGVWAMTSGVHGKKSDAAGYILRK